MPTIKGNSLDAGMVKLVYTTDSKSVAFGRGGSSPPTGTIFKQQSLDESRGFVVSAPREIALLANYPQQAGCWCIFLLVCINLVHHCSS